MRNFYLLLTILFYQFGMAQDTPPVISYTTPNVFKINKAITTLTPSNTGGLVNPWVSTFAGSGTTGTVDGIGTDASFTAPSRIAIDTNGNLYVSATNSHVIRKITPGGEVSIFAGTASTGGFLDGSCATALFQYPMGLAIYGNKLYVADRSNHRIREINLSTNMVDTYAGTGTIGNLDGSRTSATFSYPMGIAVSSTGVIYVTESYNNIKFIRQITSSGQVVKFAGGGTLEEGGKLEVTFSNPEYLAVDSTGDIVYVADYNKPIKKIYAGNVSNFGYGMLNPNGITVDANGNVYASSGYSSSIYKITPQDKRSLYAGTDTSGAAGTGSADGNAITTASFNKASDLVLDSSGNVYVCDTNNNKIRKITSSEFTVSPALPAGLVLDNANGKISGTPTVSVVATDYTITAKNLGGSGNTVVSIKVDPITPPVFTYTTPNVFERTKQITAMLPVHTGDEVPSTYTYSITPPLPDGLMFQDGTGRIYGAPTNLQDPTNYVVKVSNAGGEGSFTFSIEVVPATPFTLTYPTPNVFTKDVAIAPLVPTITGGTVTNFTISPTLPSGLGFNNLTGNIVGTPTVTSAAKYYTVSYTGSGIMGVFDLSIEVKAAPATPTIKYATPQVYQINKEISTLTPTVTGTVTGFSVNPVLPTGLNINPTTGAITGTPTALSSSTKYTVTATYTGGTTNCVLYISVQADPVSNTPVISYTSPQVYTIGTAITDLIPTSTGATPDSFSVSPSLSKGLVLNSETGVISGTPTEVMNSRDYEVTATKGDYTGTAKIRITVLDVPLPKDYFRAESYGETCPGKKGVVKIIAKDNTRPFSAGIYPNQINAVENVVTISNLAAGTHKITVTLKDNPGFGQFFNVVITAATPLVARSSVMENRVAVNVDKGTSPYTIAINGDDQFETEQSSFVVPVEPGDLLEVKTAKACEGVYKQSIDEALGNILACFPNPTQGGFEVAMPENVADNADAQIFSMSGVLISSGTYAVKNGKISLSLDSQPNGMYVVKVYAGNKEYALKVIKK